MPIRIQNDLPAKAILEQENIFVMDEKRALSQDIRPLQILILNLMPLKEDTELPENPGSISINMDNYGGMHECVKHLIEKHHVRKPGYISGPKDHSDSRRRLAARLPSGARGRQ